MKELKKSINSDEFKQTFAEEVSELVGIKGSFFLYTILIICFYVGLTIYGTTLIEDWFQSSIFGSIGIVTAIVGGFISGIWLILALLKYSLTTISHYVFISYNNILLDEIEQMNQNPENQTNRSSNDILKQYVKEVVAPVLAGIICAFIPIIGGFVVGKIEKSISKIANKLALEITSETALTQDKKEQYLATIKLMEKRESQITPKIHTSFSLLIFPFAFCTITYLLCAIGSFTYFY